MANDNMEIGALVIEAKNKAVKRTYERLKEMEDSIAQFRSYLDTFDTADDAIDLVHEQAKYLKGNMTASVMELVNEIGSCRSFIGEFLDAADNLEEY